MLIDSHAHLTHEFINGEEIVLNMEADGIEKIVTIGVDIESSIKAVEFANKHKNVYCAVGIHPDDCENVTEKDYEILEQLALNDKVVAIGEIGLDYHNEGVNKQKQKEIFIRQIKIAKKHNLPICIHTRNAPWDTYQILKEFSDDIVKPSIMHCYSETGAYAKLFLNLGFYISFSGNITYKKTDRSYLKSIPIDKILVETDSPFLSPEPLRGSYNQPARVKFTAQKIADILEMSFEDFARQTVENTYNVYKKMKRE